MQSHWTLPEYIADVLPPEAQRIELLRRLLLDTFRVHGYELTMPPLLEYVESLLTGTGHDMELRTFKLVDQLSGRTMGLRADITPQVARIDAHLLNREGVTRLAYCGSVLHTLPAGLTVTREPLQIGAEIYGHAGIEADLEIQGLLLSALRLAGAGRARLDLGHVRVFRALAELAGLKGAAAESLFALMQSKDIPGLKEATAQVEPTLRTALLRLPRLYGGREVIEAARHELPAHPHIAAALADLDTLAAAIPAGQTSIDLAELRGYQYHSGVVFAAYVDGLPNAIARGGRYDEVGRIFGRARPATGFSLDLRELAAFIPSQAQSVGILAPWQQDAALQAKIAELRGAGEMVVQALPEHDRASWVPCCNRELVSRGGAWTVVPLDGAA
ncbi:MAG TPA: ATP phosphoribosyltransferase regulatory subunit [Burkholderiales bacterium]